MSDLLWQKPGVAVDAEIQRFLAGDDVVLDREFFLHDIQASAAHAEGLQRIGICLKRLQSLVFLRQLEKRGGVACGNAGGDRSWFGHVNPSAVSAPVNTDLGERSPRPRSAQGAHVCMRLMILGGL